MAKPEAPSDRDEERRKRLAPDELPPVPVEAPAPSGAAEPYHVLAPVFYGGKGYGVGADISLSMEDALSLGDAIAAGPAPKTLDPNAPLPASGTYKITQVGSILREGKMHGPGDVIELSASEAKDFADRIQPV